MLWLKFQFNKHDITVASKEKVMNVQWYDINTRPVKNRPTVFVIAGFTSPVLRTFLICTFDKYN